ncbi:MAG: nitrite/sulfite reductase [Candidatus Omnitrophota bacterium]|jgi:sulfite reductase beta subunit-like hemoprotein|nr:MAG: nitrite/sulfite reductase [Candidatus Omnitrophota bacterium]
MSETDHQQEKATRPKKISVEELKQRENGLDIWREIEGWATTGYDSIPPEKFEFFKWYGIYRQKPNVGHLMLRVRIPGGKMKANQARVAAQIAREFGRGTLDITVRQNFQIHWLTIETIPEAVRRLHAVGLTTTMACGDVPRNILSCPVAGKCKDQIVDDYAVVRQLTREVVGNRAYSNLPRKFKMSISGCPIHCPLPEINDIGLYGVVRKKGNRKEAGFNLIAGGGLSTKPLFGKAMNAFVPTDKAVEVCRAILDIFRDQGYRESRKRARMKFLVEDLGAEAFRAEIVKRLGYDFEPAVEAEIDPCAFRDHVGIQEQRQKGFYSLGFSSTAGRITPEDLFVAADIAEQYGSGELANSIMQNLIVTDVPEDKLEEAQDMAINAPTLTLRVNPIRAGMIACTGSQFCNLAVTETKQRSFEIIDYLEKTVQLDTPIKIALSGCPNSCSQFQIGDIGLRGGKTRVGDELVESYDIFAGCEMGLDGQFGELVKKAVPADEVAFELAEMLNTYKRERQNGETFQQYTRRLLTASYEI